MKKLLTIVSIIICLTLGVTIFTACNGNKDILVVSRESGSGTRDAFDGLVKNAAGDSLAKKADGSAYDGLTANANIQNSTGSVMTKVSSVKTAIGYISLGSLNDTVKAVKVGGISASAENVLNSSYKLQRPFVLMTKKDITLTDATADFIKYLGSKQAQSIVENEKYVRQDKKAEDAYDYTAPTAILNGTIVIKGSTSVDPLMDKLIADYKAKGGAKVNSIDFSKDAQGSSQGISAAKADTTGNVIGMSSSSMKAADAASLEYFHIALDAVAIIVNKDNALEDITIAQLFDIYTGTVTKFEDIK